MSRGTSGLASAFSRSFCSGFVLLCFCFESPAFSLRRQRKLMIVAALGVAPDRMDEYMQVRVHSQCLPFVSLLL